MNIKKALKEILPASVVEIIRKAKRSVYEKYVRKVSRKYPHYLKQINGRPHTDKIKIAFYACTPAFWNSLKTVYEAADSNSKINAYVVLLPGRNGRGWQYSSPEFYYEQNLTVYKAYDEERRTWMDLKDLQPDYVFFEHPYNDRLPRSYKSQHVEKFAKICYIPYGYILTDSQEKLDLVMNKLFLSTLYIFFASWKDVGVYCEKMFAALGCRERKVAFLGYPRFDLLVKEKAHEQGAPFCVMWVPRYLYLPVTAVEAASTPPTEHTSFFDYKDKILERSRTVQDEKWLIRPHPIAFKSYIEHGLMTYEEVEKYKQDVACANNIELDRCKDYLVGFANADVLVADFSSTIIEYFVTGKPIIYCGDTAALPFVFLKECVYPVENWEQLEAALKRLKAGDDPLQEKRVAASKKLGNQQNGKIGESIIQYIVDDYERTRADKK